MGLAPGAPPNSSTPSNSDEGHELPIPVRRKDWPVEAKVGGIKEGTLWPDYFQQIEYFEHAKFYFVKAHFLDDKLTWQAKVGFKGLARTADGTWQSVNAKLETEWRRDGGSAEDVADPLGWVGE